MSLEVIVGGQFGSEAKGAVTAALTAEHVRLGRDVTVIRVGGPNAGHSAYDPQGRLWALRQIPVGMVVDPSVTGVIGDGSEIDPQVLNDEIVRLEDAGHRIQDRLYISDEATLIYPRHKALEAELVGRVGSTGKGIGAARAERLMRNADRVKDNPLALLAGTRVKPGPEICRILNTQARASYSVVALEGTQGYGLGLTAGYYPQCTSSNTRAIDFLAMAGINPWGILGGPTIHVVVRPYPIRVAGNSGPLLGETTWADLGLKEELTTVTKKVRRVGEWDPALVRAALQANGPTSVLALSMVDQVPGMTEPLGERKVLTPAGTEWIEQLQQDLATEIRWYGTGPRLQDWRQW